MSLKDFHDKTLYLIEILHQTTTLARPALFPPGCILSKFYIKPQQRILSVLDGSGCILSKFYIKPQQGRGPAGLGESCILSKFYIKPQLTSMIVNSPLCCILSKFYIKPQLKIIHSLQSRVVSYRNSTSNHNPLGLTSPASRVVSYRNSTSNHNITMR